MTNLLDEVTNTQRKLLDALADGLPHRQGELRLALGSGGYASRGMLRVHLSNLRKVLRPRGQDIICEWHRRSFCYRWVKLLLPAIYSQDGV